MNRDLVLRPFGMMDDFFGGIDIFDSGKNVFEPKVNIRDNENCCLIDIEMAGVDKKNIDIKLENGYLIVNANKKEENKDEKDNYIKREIKSYNYTKSFKLNDSLNVEKIKAESKDGILTIEIPKIAKKKPKFIKIT